METTVGAIPNASTRRGLTSANVCLATEESTRITAPSWTNARLSCTTVMPTPNAQTHWAATTVPANLAIQATATFAHVSLRLIA